MNKILYVQIITNYGKALVYPNCTQSKLLCELAGKKTITKDMQDTIKQLGYEFAVQAPQLG